MNNDQIKELLQEKYVNAISQFNINDVINEINYRKILNSWY
jgi:hypothetical protein